MVILQKNLMVLCTVWVKHLALFASAGAQEGSLPAARAAEEARNAAGPQRDRTVSTSVETSAIDGRRC